MKLAFIALMLLACVPAGVACTCMAGQTGTTMLDEAKWQVDKSEADAIFEGTVTAQELKGGSAAAPANAMSMTPAGAHREVTIAVSQRYRGTVPQTVTVLTGLGTGDCGFDFEVGKSYVVFGSFVQGGTFFTSICTGTELSERAGATLRYLRGDKPTADDLLSGDEYLRRMLPKWTGSVCGKVTGPDGKPVGGADVSLYEIRNDPFPAGRFSDPNTSKADGTYCIKGAEPGSYLLTAETQEYDTNSRLMGFYPGVKRHSDAVPFEIDAGRNESGVDFSLFREQLFSVRFRVLTSDGTRVPSENLGVKIDSPDQDPLAYHEYHGVEANGTYTLGLIPPGHYIVTTYFEPVEKPDGSYAIAPESSQWVGARKEVDIENNDTVDVILQRAAK